MGVALLTANSAKSGFTVEETFFLTLASFFTLPRAMRDTFATQTVDIPLQGRTEATVKVWALWLFGSTLITLIIVYCVMWYFLEDTGIYKVELAYGRWLQEKMERETELVDSTEVDEAHEELPHAVLHVESNNGVNRVTVAK